MYRTVSDFVAALESAGELRRVREPVSPILEVGAIADRASKGPAPSSPAEATRLVDPRFYDRGGPALLFESVEGADHPVLINALGSYRRIEMALGCGDGGHTPGGLEALADRIGVLAQPQPPRSFKEAIEVARRLAPLLKIGPKRRGGGDSQEVVLTGDQIDLTRLPILRCWPHDGDLGALGYPAGINAGIEGIEDAPDWDARHRGRYVTLAGIHTVHADDADDPRPASHNIGMYRVQLFGRRRVAMHWHMHHDGASHWRSWKRAGKPMPVAIALGGESVLPYSATAPLPPGLSELLLAGFLNGSGIRLTRAKTVPLWVPANAEIVIEGWVNPEAGVIGYDPRSTEEPLGPGAVFEGPFGDHTGFYSLPDRYPIVEVTAVTHRRGAVYPTTIVGLPPQEDYFMGKATERLFRPLLQTLIHDIEDYDLPMFGAFHNCAVLQIDKQYPLQARRVMHAVWGAGQMAWTKLIFVVDRSVDVHDVFAVLSAAGRSCHPARDVETVNGPLDILDHAAPRLGAGTKMGFDCTTAWPGEEVDNIPASVSTGYDGSSGEAILAFARSQPGVAGAHLDARCFGWLFLRMDRGIDPVDGSVRAVIQSVLSQAGAPPFVVALGRDVQIDDPDQAMFHWCANMDPGRDAVRVNGGLGFDATPKAMDTSHPHGPIREWPPVLAMPEPVIDRVSGICDALGV